MELISNLKNSITNLENKSSKIYFFTQDTKGNPKASIHYIYQMAYVLKQNGFNSVILHEKSDYTSVSSWLDSKYSDELPHQYIEGQNLNIFPEDYLIVPEIFAYIMPQLTNLNCTKIVLCQSYDYITETLQPGESWQHFGFLKCITTSEKLKEQVSNIMRNISFDIIEPLISDNFEEQKLPPNPIIAIHTRDQRDSINFIKTFYLKFSQYRWVSFRDMRGLSEEEFAKNMNGCFLSIWIDETSSYGTFPLESMKMGIPVMGLVPNVIPSWMNEDNGLWINNKNEIVDYAADYLQNWLEDNVNEKIFVEMKKTIEQLITEEKFNQVVIETFQNYLTKRANTFEEQINKFKELQENGEN